MKPAFARDSRIVTTLIAFALPAHAQTLPQSSPQNTSIRTRSEAVLLDVVVRDKRGRLVTSLTPEDFQIFDNGEPRRIDSFRLVQGNEEITTSGKQTRLDPLRQIRLVTMIFQCSSVEAQRLSRGAAFEFLRSGLPQNVYIAVMAIDHSLEVLQPFTNNPALLKSAIDRATRNGSTDFLADTLRVKKQLENSLGSTSAGLQSGQGQQIPSHPSVNSAAFTQAAMDSMLLAMLELMQSGAIRETGQVNLSALFDAVREQYQLPGRKTVLYFTERGFAIPQGLEASFQNIISVANRSNVSFYTVDARGLETSTQNSDAIFDLNRAAAATASQASATTTEAVTHSQATMVDTAIQSTRGNAQNALANLADSTGGKLIGNTNDFNTPLKKLAEDIETYYEISYIPEIKNYDGSFHKIIVKTRSIDLRVQSRSGYFALPPGVNGITNPLHAYEVPFLNALASNELPHDFPLQSAVMHFRGANDQPVYVLAIDVPLQDLTFVQKRPDTWEGHLSYVVLVKNGKGEVIKKFQNEIPMNIPAAKIQAAKTSHFTYTEHLELPPGHFSVQAAALDSESENRVSGRNTSLFVPAPSSSLSLSSVVFVRNMKDKDASTGADDPLAYGSKVIWPELRPVVAKQTGANLAFYVVIYQDHDLPSPPKLALEFSKDGQLLGQTSLDLPASTGVEGRIPYLGTIPLASLNPGDYTIRFIVQQGSETAEESASLTVR